MQLTSITQVLTVIGITGVLISGGSCWRCLDTLPWCIHVPSGLCFYIDSQSSGWNLTFMFIYGDGETEILEGPSERSGTCMRVGSSHFCFSESPFSGDGLRSDFVNLTWSVSSVNYTMPRPTWTFDSSHHRTCETVTPQLCFALSGESGRLNWRSRVQFMRGAQPRAGPHDERLDVHCADMRQTVVCFSEQPLADSSLKHKKWILDPITFSMV